MTKKLQPFKNYPQSGPGDREADKIKLSHPTRVS